MTVERGNCGRSLGVETRLSFRLSGSFTIRDDDANALCPPGPWHNCKDTYQLPDAHLMEYKVGLHYILSFTHEEYGKATSVSRLSDYIGGSAPPHRETVPEQYYKPAEPIYIPDRKANATFAMLVRNSDLSGIMSSIRQIEDRFNRKFNYPYVLLNDEPFTEDFKKYDKCLGPCFC